MNRTCVCGHVEEDEHDVKSVCVFHDPKVAEEAGLDEVCDCVSFEWDGEE